MQYGNKTGHYQCYQSNLSTSEVCLHLPTPTLGAQGSRDQGVLFLGLSVHRGYLLLWRKAEDSAVFRDTAAWHVFSYLLIKAQWQNEKYSCIYRGQHIYLKRGQVVTGRHQIANALNMPPSTVRNAITRLKLVYNIINVKSDNKRTIITLLNWGIYQNNEKKEDNGTTSEGQQKDTNQPLSIKHKEETDMSFLHFWSAYPKKESKIDAEKAWKKLNPPKDLLEKILLSVERSKLSASWMKENGQYIPLPATWLRGRRWEDEVKEFPTPKQPGPPLQWSPR